MSDAFKHLLHAGTIRWAGEHLQRAWPDFDRPRFEHLALGGLEALEFKARALHLAAALAATLPGDFEHACSLIEASLAPTSDRDPDLPGPDRDERDGLAGWVVWPLGEYVSQQAVADPAKLPRALRNLHALTQRFTAEFAIRPLLQQHPEAVWPTLRAWVHDPSAHVRRLVSEGSRPRLPWGLRLSQLVRDPSPTLPLLAALQDDPSPYVRRSVANHLNDIAKDHPEVVVAWLQAHLPGAPAARRALLKHASRSLVKQAHPAVLAAWGTGAPLQGQLQLRLGSKTLSVGEALPFEVHVRSSATQAQPLLIDYVVHHMKANGTLSPKVFKAWSFTLPAGDERTLNKQHSFRPITTRRYHPGTHRLAVQVNGQVLAEAEFMLHATDTDCG